MCAVLLLGIWVFACWAAELYRPTASPAASNAPLPQPGCLGSCSRCPPPFAAVLGMIESRSAACTDERWVSDHPG